MELRCGGEAMVPQGAPEERHPLNRPGGTLLGKRYTDIASELIVLVTRPGVGQLSVDDTPLEQVATQLLPSSD
jgi:hypothetical protein